MAKKTGKSYEIIPPGKKDLRSNGTTALVTVREDVTEKQLLEYGFYKTNNQGYNYMLMLTPNVSFNLLIDGKDSSNLKIDVLEESFLQPYDYQAKIMSGDFSSTDRGIFNRVSKELNKMQDAKILQGYRRGMYI